MAKITWSKEVLIEKFKEAYEIYGKDITSKEFSTYVGRKSHLHSSTFRKAGFNGGWTALRAYFKLPPNSITGPPITPVIWTKEFMKQCLTLYLERYGVEDCTLAKFKEETGVSSEALRREWGSWNNLKKSCGLPIWEATGGRKRVYGSKSRRQVQD